MAELPEVETLRRQLERDVVGRKVKTVEILDNKAVRRHSNKKDFVARIEGAKLKSLMRRGTFLIFTLDTLERLIVQPGPSGLLVKAAPKDAIAPGTALVVSFTQGGQVRFIDPKHGGEVWLLTPDEVALGVDEIELIGFDVVDTPVPWADFARLVVNRSVKLRSLLTEEGLLAGIGPVYCDEILYDAGLRHERTSDSLTVQEVRRLYRSVVEILHDAVKHGGTSLADDGWRDLHGATGGYGEYHQVFGRDGEPCRRCRDTIVKAKIGGRTVYYCAQCQT